MRNAAIATYTPYKAMTSYYINWIFASKEKIEKAEEMLCLNKKTYVTKADAFGSLDYLFKGNLVKTRVALSSDTESAWAIKLFSESEKGLEKLAKKLGLPSPKKWRM